MNSYSTIPFHVNRRKINLIFEVTLGDTIIASHEQTSTSARMPDVFSVRRILDLKSMAIIISKRETKFRNIIIRLVC